jgi:hypothetical protein
VCIGLTVTVPIPPYVAYRRHRCETNVPYRLAFKILDSMNERGRAHGELAGGTHLSQLERSVIAETIEAFDPTRNGRATARRAESSAKQATNDRIADSTEPE